MAACASATVIPSLRRAFTRKIDSLGRRPSASAMPKASSEAIGSQKSVTIPTLTVPLWPAGPTPTIVTGTPSIRMARPITAGLPPNLFVHVR